MTKGRDSKPHIGIFGRRNTGKSSIINVLTGQYTAIVSDIAGTTTDPVRKSIEIQGIGPVILIDTAGTDDIGDLGTLRVEKTRSVIAQIDLAILILTDNQFSEEESRLINIFNGQELPFLIVFNKNDLHPVSVSFREKIRDLTSHDLISFSARVPEKYLPGLLTAIKETIPPNAYRKQGLLGDLLSYGDIVLLITPVDIEAPEGRLILPQVQMIRDILDNECTAIVLKEREVDGFLRKTAIRPDRKSVV
jgi:[FeFe] hydrogenase H-cluster maturation GTPase HydF